MGADALTSQLEILPFAKMCIDYKVGDPLPSTITVVDLDNSKVEVNVSYVNKPLICVHCKSLGHLINVCPTATRVWVKKGTPTGENNGENVGGKSNEDFVEKHDWTVDKDNQQKKQYEVLVEENSNATVSKENNDLQLEPEGGKWTEVKSKRKPLASPSISSGSPSPQLFKDGMEEESGTKKGGPKSKMSKRAKRFGGSPPQKT